MVVNMRKMKKFRSIVLVSTLALGLCACGKNEKTGGSIADTQMAKQYVYSEQNIDLSALGFEEDYNINNMKQVGERLYMVVNSYEQNDDKGSTRTYLKLVSMNSDGSDIKKIDLQLPAEESNDIANIPENGESNETDSHTEEAVTEEVVTEEAVTEDAVTEDAVTEDTVIEVMPEMFGESAKYEWTGFGYVAFVGEQIYVTKEHTIEDWSDPENYVSQNNTSVCSWDMEGNFKWETPIEGIRTEEEYSFVQTMVPLKDNTVALIIGGDNYKKVTVDSEGNVSQPMKLSAESSRFQNMDRMMARDDGTIIFTYYDDEWTNMYVATYDIEADTISEGTKLPSNLMWMGYNSMAAGINNDLVFSTSNGIYSYTLGDTEIKQMMSYVNSDLNVGSINQIMVLDDTHFLASYNDNSYEYKLHCSLFTKVKPEDIPDKEVIVIAGSYVDGDLKKRAIEYNKESQTHRIVINEYDMYNSGDDYMAGYTKLNNEIISGNMPDILITEGMDANLDSYIAKGLLADIGALIAKDEELSKKEFMENVFEAYKVDGKLYQLIPSFRVQTVIGKKSILGERNGWTMEEMQEVLASMPEETKVFGDMTRDNFIYYMMDFGGSDFVDVTTGKCNFNSQQFIDMLEYAKTLPKELSEDYYADETWYLNYQSQYREDRTLLMPLYINGFSDMKYQINGFFGEDVTYVGFPSDHGTGAIIAVNNSYVLSAKSKKLDAAWDFIRYYLTDEYQNKMNWGIPVSKDAFQEKSKDATCKSYWVNEKGEKEEYDDYFDINGESIILEPLNQQQLEELVTCIESVNKRSYYSQELQKIITEEVEAFFTGQKSAADVAKIIQSRAQIYVNENM